MSGSSLLSVMVTLLHNPLTQLGSVGYLVLAAGMFHTLNARTSLQLGDSTGASGASIEVPLNLFTQDPVSGAQIDLYANPALAEIVNVAGSSAGEGHSIDTEDFGEGRVRVLVYSSTNEILFTEALIDLELKLNATIEENARAVIVENITLADAEANFLNAALIPHATFSGPDDSVIYKMGDAVIADSVAYGTKAEVERVEFLVDGWAAASDSEPPYEGNFPLHYFGNITISARAVDKDGNRFESSPKHYEVTFPPTYEDWLAIFFTSEEQLDPDLGILSADSDFDGQTTFEEYAMGLHPRNRDGPRESGFFRNMRDGSYEFGYTRPVGVSGVNYTLQTSNNMVNWMDAGANGSMEIIPISNYLEEVRFTLFDLALPREFGRVLIEKAGP